MEKYIGKVLDGRYEILEVIGVGGMSVVYKAHCNRLNRYVAIKILKEELFAEENLRRQFHDESQSVAILSHPNIVSVYDVSHYEDTEYIVMELIDGITLKEYLQRRGALPWKEATFFALQIAKALEHAHSRGIIHRDIKPQNMMLLRDGTLKVTDFGIAKNTVQQGTKTIGEAIGSVHYVSPEQAKGSVIDSRSDIYSFGVVMYEMLTGRLPFEGDSPVSIAIQHINSIALPPSDFVDNIPAALEAITMKSMNPTLAKRYASAGEVLHDLECFRSDPYFTMPAVNDMVQAKSDDTEVKAVTEEKNTEDINITENTGKNEGKYSAKTADKSHRVLKKRRPAPIGKKKVYKPANPEERKNVKKQPARTTKRPAKEYKYGMAGFSGAIIFALIAILLFLGGVMLFIIEVINPFGSPDNTKLKVPNLVGLYYQDVINSLEYFEYNIEPGEYLYSDVYENGQIMDQSPEAKRSISGDQVIVVDISRGPKAFKLPDYAGSGHEEVEIELRQKGIKTVLEGVNSDDVPAGKVISTKPQAGESVSQDDVVTIIYSEGKAVAKVSVPDLFNLTAREAMEKLAEVGLVAGTPLYMEHDTVAAGRVIYQTIAADSQIDIGTEVSYHISTGKSGGTVAPPVQVGYGTSYDPFPNDSRKRVINFDLIFEEAEGEISVSVMVNRQYTEYEGVHYYSEGHIVIPLTAPEGWNTVTVYQNGVITFQGNVQFG